MKTEKNKNKDATTKEKNDEKIDQKLNSRDERRKARKAEFLEDYKRSAGIYVSCKKLQIAPSSIWRWRKTDKRFDRKCKEIENYFLNAVECKAFKIALKKGDVNMIKFLLLTRMRDKYAYDNSRFDQDKKKVVLNISAEEAQY